MKRDSGKGRKGRVVAFLTREEIDFIDKLSKDALFSTGHKLTRNDIIRAMIDVIKIKNIDVKGIGSRPEFEKKLLLLMRITLPETADNLKMEKGRIR